MQVSTKLTFTRPPRDLWSLTKVHPVSKLGSVVLVTKFGWYYIKNLEEEAFLVRIWKKRSLTFVSPTWHLTPIWYATFVKLRSVVLVTKFGWYCIKNLEEEAFLVRIWKKRSLTFVSPTWPLTPIWYATFVKLRSVVLVTRFGWYCIKNLEEEAFLVRIWKKRSLTFVSPTWPLTPIWYATFVKLRSVVLVTKFGWYYIKNLEEELSLVRIWI